MTRRQTDTIDALLTNIRANAITEARQQRVIDELRAQVYLLQSQQDPITRTIERTPSTRLTLGDTVLDYAGNEIRFGDIQFPNPYEWKVTQ